MVAFWLHNWSYGGICEDKNRTIALDLQSWLKILLRTERFERVVLYVSCCLVVKLCPTLCDPMDCSLPGTSVHGISQERILEWVAIFFSKGSSQPRDWTHVSYVFYIGGRILNHWATWEAQNINTNPLRNIMVCRRFMADHYSNFGSNELFFKSIAVQNGLQVSDLWL